MSTSAFDLKWRQSGRMPVALAVIELTTPTTATIRAATAECIAGAYAFEAGLECDPIDDACSLLSPGPDPVTATFRLVNRRFAAVAPYGLTRSLAAWRFKGATVSLYRWERRLTDFADACLVFSGQIDTIEAGIGFVQFVAVQSRAFNEIVASVAVDKTTRPNAPDTGASLRVPRVWGNHTTPALRGVAAGAGHELVWENSGGGRGVVPLVLTDTGAGADVVRVEGASHAISDLFNTSGTARLFMPGPDGTLLPVDSALSTITEVLTGPSYADIDDEGLVVRAPLRPIDVRTAVNTAEFPRRAIDPLNERQFAVLDQGAGKSRLDLLLPNPYPLGTIYGGVDVIVFFTGDAANTNDLRVRPYDGAGFGTTLTTASTPTTMQAAVWTWPNTWYSGAWEFGLDNGGMTYAGHLAGRQISIAIDFTGGAGNKARIYSVALSVKFKPYRNLLTPGATAEIRGPAGALGAYGFGGGSLFRWIIDAAHGRATFIPATPSTYEIDSAFYACLKGYVDDGSGTYTGSAGAVIERVPDILRHLLAVVGGVSGGSIETTAGAHGSFVDGRSAIRDGGATDIVAAVHVADDSRVQDVIRKLCEQTLCHVWHDPLTSKWRFRPWKRGALPSYAWPIEWEHTFEGLRISEESVADVVTEIRVQYLFDHARGRSLAEAFVSASGSSQGWNEPEVRDQRLVVEAGVNDDFDWKTGAWGGGPFTYADTLTAGTYEPIDLAAHVQSKLRARVPAYYSFVGHGVTIKAGHNDDVEWWYGADKYAIVMSPGRRSMDALASALAYAMNEEMGLVDAIRLTYDHATNKWTIATTTGVNISLESPTTASAPGTLFWPTLGWVNGTGAATSHTAPRERYASRFWDLAQATMTWQALYATGASAATSCASLLGYPATDQSVAAYHSATASRDDRETRAAALVSAYKSRERRTIVCDWLRSEAAATSTRDRAWDLGSEPSHAITFAHPCLHDLARLQTFRVGSSLDERVPFIRYGSDGEWGGKVLLCLSNRHHMGPSFHNEIVAVEA